MPPTTRKAPGGGASVGYAGVSISAEKVSGSRLCQEIARISCEASVGSLARVDMRRLDQLHAVVGNRPGQALGEAGLRLGELADKQCDLARVKGQRDLVRGERAPAGVTARPAQHFLGKATPDLSQGIPGR